MDISPNSAPAALADLIAAGLVSHEAIGDPDRLGGETETLRALCALVSGPVWRLEPFHYAFRAAAGDLGGTLGDRDPEDWAAALETALQADLGEGAAWITPTDLVGAATALDRPLLLLRAHAEAVTGGLAAAAPELQAVIGARFAAAAARLAAGEAEASFAAMATTGPLAERLAAIEARQAEILAALEPRAALGGTLARLSETLAAVLDRLDAQSEVLHGHLGREEMIAGRLAELAERATAPEAFQESLGVTIAEFLARLERREAEAPARVVS